MLGRWPVPRRPGLWLRILMAIASLANMVKAQDQGLSVMAYSPATCEEFSATPGDYFMQRPDWVMTDWEGNEMVLATRQTVFIEVELED